MARVDLRHVCESTVVFREHGCGYSREPLCMDWHDLEGRATMEGLGTVPSFTRLRTKLGAVGTLLGGSVHFLQ